MGIAQPRTISFLAAAVGDRRLRTGPAYSMMIRSLSEGLSRKACSTSAEPVGGGRRTKSPGSGLPPGRALISPPAGRDGDLQIGDSLGSLRASEAPSFDLSPASRNGEWGASSPPWPRAGERWKRASIPRAWRRITDSQDSAISPKRRDLAQSPPMERAATSRTLTRFRVRCGTRRGSALPSGPGPVTARRVR